MPLWLKTLHIRINHISLTYICTHTKVRTYMYMYICIYIIIIIHDSLSLNDKTIATVAARAMIAYRQKVIMVVKKYAKFDQFKFNFLFDFAIILNSLRIKESKNLSNL